MDNISEARTEVESISAPHNISHANNNNVATASTSISQEPIFQSEPDAAAQELENNVSFFVEALAASPFAHKYTIFQPIVHL